MSKLRVLLTPMVLGPMVLAWFLLLPLTRVCYGFDIGRAIGSVVKVAEGTRNASEEEEIEMGRQFAAMVLGAYSPNNQPSLNDYVSKVGLTVAQQSARPNLAYHFQVISARDAGGTPLVNAFSTPGGYIFVTEGLMAELNSEAALAGILAHEVAHVAEKHILKEIKRQNIKTGLMDLGGTIAEGAGVSQNFATVLGPAIANNIFEKGFSKGDEYRADAAAVRYASGAGYNPEGLIVFLEELRAKQGKIGVATLFRTHPDPGNRVSRIRQLIAKEHVPSGKTLDDRWQREIH